MKTKVTKKEIENCTGSLEQFGVKVYNARLSGIHYETNNINKHQLIKLNFDGKEEIISRTIQSKTDFVNAVYNDINRLASKTKKPTKKEIITELRSLDCTRIHRIAAKCGVDANNEYSVKGFCREHSPSVKLYNHISAIISTRGLERFTMSYIPYEEPTIKRICRKMREQIKWGMSAYSKILIEGKECIYWASPVYLHKDYYKSRAMANTERNRKIMTLVNTHLAKHGIK